ncbi:phage tail tape measure protein [Phycicoccus avicenniae]|uniref:phage tail tape measure protein n=1 Tax=Phycicoccus avicenniae TaxID=2828860 RepID=UPI003D280534
MERTVVTRYEAKIEGYLASHSRMEKANQKLAQTTVAAAKTSTQTRAQSTKSAEESAASIVKALDKQERAERHLASVQIAAQKEDAARSAKRSASMRELGDQTAKTATVAGLALGTLVATSVKKYADFEAEMSKVAAVTNATTAEQEKLSRAAIQAGQDTVFSATEAAQAQAELAKAGVKTSDILGGALRGSLDLAAAGGLDLAKSAEIAAQSMNIFNKEGSDVGHIADVLTAGANKSAAGVDDLGLALQQGGLVAKQTGLTFEDTVGVLSAFADNALKGSDAGTSLKTMLQRLNPQSDEAAALMDQLGLRAYDAQGNFVGLEKYAGMLQSALSGMSAEQRNAALQTLFGSDAVRGANVLYEQGAAGIREYIAAVDDQGAAQRMAARMTDNLKGDLEQLSGTLESAFINGGSGSSEALRDLVQMVTGLVDRFNDLSPSTQNAVVKIAAATAAALLLSAAAIKTATSVAAMKASIEAAGISGGKLTTSLKAAGTAAAVLGGITIAGSAMQDMWVGLSGANDDATRSLQAYIDGGSDAKYVTDQMGYGLSNLADQVNQAMNHGFLNNVGEFFAEIGTVGGIFGPTRRDEAEAFFATLDKGLAGLQRSNPEQAAATFAKIAKEMQAQGYSLDQTRELLPQFSAALDTSTVSAQGTAGAVDQLTNANQKTAEVTEEAAQAQIDLAKALVETRDAALAASNSNIALGQANADLAKTAEELNGQTNKSRTAFDLSKKSGRDAQTALNEYAATARKAAEDNLAAGDSTAKVGKAMDTSREAFIKAATQMGLSKKAASEMADEFGLSRKGVNELKGSLDKLPSSKNVNVNVKTYGLSGLQQAQAYLRNVRDKSVTLTVGTVRVGNTRVNAGQFADGGAAIGPGTATSDSIPALLSNGEHVLTASDVQKAGGQGAIYRMRAGIQAGQLRFAAGGAVGPAKFADGGEVDWSDILDILRDITTSDEVERSRQTTASRATTLKSASTSLATMRRQLAAANRAVRAAAKTKGRSDDNAALEKRRVLLGKIAVQEDRVALATSKVTSARKAQRALELEYTADRRGILDRTLSASSSSNTKSKKFLDNIDKLTRMGFKTLALELLNMGGVEAEGIAAQAVLSAAKARALESQLNTSAGLSAREQAIRDALEGKQSGTADPQLSWYAQVRNLGRMASAAPASGRTVATGPTVVIQGALDPIAVGRQVEKVLQDYSSVTGQPVRIEVQR